MSDHTPGPWDVEDYSNQHTLEVFGPPLNGDVQKRICTVHSDASRSKARDRANADLIAAAPDLLKALAEAGEAIHSEYCGSLHHPECAKVSAAISKAEGK